MATKKPARRKATKGRRGKKSRGKTFIPKAGTPHAQERIEREIPPPPTTGHADVFEVEVELEGEKQVVSLSPSEYLFCTLIKSAYPGRLAAIESGAESDRAKAGARAAVLLRRPEIRAVIRTMLLEEISDLESDGRLGAMCRGEHPTKIVEGPDGPRVEFDHLEAIKHADRLKGRLKDQLEHSGPGGGPIPHEVNALTDEALAARIEALRSKGGLASA